MKLKSGIVLGENENLVMELKLSCGLPVKTQSLKSLVKSRN